MKKFYIERIEDKNIYRVFDEENHIVDYDDLDTEISQFFDSFLTKEVLEAMNDRKIDSLMYPIDADAKFFIEGTKFFAYQNLEYLDSKELSDCIYFIISRTNDVDKEKFFINVITAEEYLKDLFRKEGVESNLDLGLWLLKRILRTAFSNFQIPSIEELI